MDKHWLWLENNLLPTLEEFDNTPEAIEFAQAKIKSLIANEQDTVDSLDCMSKAICLCCMSDQPFSQFLSQVTGTKGFWVCRDLIIKL